MGLYFNNPDFYPFMADRLGCAESDQLGKHHRQTAPDSLEFVQKNLLKTGENYYTFFP